MRRWKKKFGDKLRDMPLFRKMMFFYIMLLCIPAAIMGAFYVGTLVKRLDGEYDKSKAEVLEQDALLLIIFHRRWNTAGIRFSTIPCFCNTSAAMI